MFDVRCSAFASFPILASPRPPRRHLRTSRRVIALARIRRTFVEDHRDIAAESGLNFHRDLRRNKRRCSIDMILKTHSFLRDLSQFCQRKNLVTATVSQDRSVPAHEFVQPAEMFDHIEAGPNEEVISIAQNDLRLQLVQFAAGVTAFTVPCVPTGMNAGVSITPCAVVNRPRRALDCRSWARSSNIAATVGEADSFPQYLRRTARILCSAFTQFERVSETRLAPAAPDNSTAQSQ